MNVEINPKDCAKYNWISEQLRWTRIKPKALQTLEDIQWIQWAEARIQTLTQPNGKE